MPVNELEFTLITGLSGAGKSQAVNCFEDLGYFCIDNLPPALLDDMAKLGLLPDSKIKKIAIVTDVRGGDFFEDLSDAIDQLRASHVNVNILYLEANDDVLINRFKETRRRHPLATGGDIASVIEREREILGELRGKADFVIDTSHMSANELRDAILSAFMRDRSSTMLCTVLSFGFKYGLPRDCDIVMDVRFLPNPHYIPELRHHTGLETPVRDFVLNHETTQEFIERFNSLLGALLPGYLSEGKSHLTIGIGCTGGHHRSVAISEVVASHVKELGYQVSVKHRDIDRDVN